MLLLILRALPNINALMHFLRTFSIMRAYMRGSKAYYYQIDSKLRNKKLFTVTENIFEIGWWGRCIFHLPPWISLCCLLIIDKITITDACKFFKDALHKARGGGFNPLAPPWLRLWSNLNNSSGIFMPFVIM